MRSPMRAAAATGGTGRPEPQPPGWRGWTEPPSGMCDDCDNDQDEEEEEDDDEEDGAAI